MIRYLAQYPVASWPARVLLALLALPFGLLARFLYWCAEELMAVPRMLLRCPDCGRSQYYGESCIH